LPRFGVDMHLPTSAKENADPELALRFYPWEILQYNCSRCPPKPLSPQLYADHLRAKCARGDAPGGGLLGGRLLGGGPVHGGGVAEGRVPLGSPVYVAADSRSAVLMVRRVCAESGVVSLPRALDGSRFHTEVCPPRYPPPPRSHPGPTLIPLLIPHLIPNLILTLDGSGSRRPWRGCQPPPVKGTLHVHPLRHPSQVRSYTAGADHAAGQSSSVLDWLMLSYADEVGASYHLTPASHPLHTHLKPPPPHNPSHRRPPVHTPPALLFTPPHAFTGPPHRRAALVVRDRREARRVPRSRGPISQGVALQVGSELAARQDPHADARRGSPQPRRERRRQRRHRRDGLDV
jgi:hypothetical protein